MCGDLYYYCFVRTDISLADQICQVSHASVEAGRRFGIPEHCNLVLLQVPNQQALLDIQAKCKRNNVEIFLNHEPDDNMGFTAACTTAIMGSTRRLFSSFPLWRDPYTGEGESRGKKLDCPAA